MNDNWFLSSCVGILQATLVPKGSGEKDGWTTEADDHQDGDVAVMNSMNYTFGAFTAMGLKADAEEEGVEACLLRKRGGHGEGKKTKQHAEVAGGLPGLHTSSQITIDLEEVSVDEIRQAVRIGDSFLDRDDRGSVQYTLNTSDGLEAGHGEGSGINTGYGTLSGSEGHHHVA